VIYAVFAEENSISAFLFLKTMVKRGRMKNHPSFKTAYLLAREI